MKSYEELKAEMEAFSIRWLAQTIRQNCKITQVTTSPLQVIPRFISPKMGFICVNDKDQIVI